MQDNTQAAAPAKDAVVETLDNIWLLLGQVKQRTSFMVDGERAALSRATEEIKRREQARGQELRAYELTVANLRARVAEMESCRAAGLVQIQEPAAPQAVQPVMPVGCKFFSFDPDGDMDIHDTADAARAKAQEAIDLYREDAAEGWVEEVERVCWGMVLGHTKEVKLTEGLPPDAFASGCAGYMKPVDYVLTVTHPTQQGLDAQKLTAKDYKLLLKALGDFDDFGETEVPDEVLQRAVVAGYLECEHYRVSNRAALLLDAAAQGVA